MSAFGVSGVNYEAKGVGKIAYRPSLANPDCGFGPYECHPQMIERTTPEGSIELAHNGDWLISCAEWSIAAANTGLGGNAREVAEKQCVVWNKGKPTRVVDLFGHLTTSGYSYDDLVAIMRARGIPTNAPEDV
jgi:hypothetical protein